MKSETITALLGTRREWEEEGLLSSCLNGGWLGLAHLNSISGWRCPKSEIRSSKSETNSRLQGFKARNWPAGNGLGHSRLVSWGWLWGLGFGVVVVASILF